VEQKQQSRLNKQVMDNYFQIKIEVKTLVEAGVIRLRQERDSKNNLTDCLDDFFADFPSLLKMTCSARLFKNKKVKNITNKNKAECILISEKRFIGGIQITITVRWTCFSTRIPTYGTSVQHSLFLLC
jgi:hypothetical protein